MPNTTGVCPERNTSQSSMQSAPKHIADTKLITLRPAFAAPARSPRSTVRSTNASIPSRSARIAGSSTPAFATARSPPNSTLVASGRPFTMWVTSCCRPAVAAYDSFLPAQEVI
jgi:hypothetical protein